MRKMMRVALIVAVVIDVLARFSPEGAGSMGVDGLDEQILDLGSGIQERSNAASEKVLAELQRRLKTETDRKVRQDIGILSKAVEDNIRSSKLNYDTLLPYYNINQTVFYGVRGLIDPQESRNTQAWPTAILP
jgi:hypothetical protein